MTLYAALMELREKQEHSDNQRELRRVYEQAGVLTDEQVAAVDETSEEQQ